MSRYVTYRALPAPPEAARYGYWNHRITEQFFFTEGHWAEAMQTMGMPTPPPRIEKMFIPEPSTPRAAVALFPARPTEDFVGNLLTVSEKTYIRWYIIFRYPDGVPVEEGEKWYLETHSKEVMQQPGLIRYFSHRAVAAPSPHPGVEMPRPWVRLSEQWYEDFDGWRKSVIEAPIKYTAPPWAKMKEPPFMEPSVDFASTFVGETPDIDFFRDVRPRP